MARPLQPAAEVEIYFEGPHRRGDESETPPLRTATLEPALLYALLERGGVKADGEEWLAPDGRRTGVLGDALERVARED